MERRDHGDGIVTLSPLLSAAECARLAELGARLGYGAAPITTRRGPVMAPEVRNNERAMADAPGEAAWLWARLREHVPALRAGARAVGLNERLRFYRYTSGQAFRWHYDGAFARSAEERSQLSALFFLSEGFAGGATEFDLPRRMLRITPRTGMALVFPHGLRHQGAEVDAGVKLVVRSDVMYRQEALETA